MRKPWLLLLLCVLPRCIPAVDAEPKTAPNVSPDKQWEYQYSNDIWARIAKAGTTAVVLDLSDGVPRPEEATVVWAPDSKRFAFKFSPPHAPHTSYETIRVYQLRGEKWEPLDSLVEESSDVAQLTQLAKGHLPKNPAQLRVWKGSPTRDILRLRKWTDAKTAIIYAYAAWDRPASAGVEAAFLFTVRFDAEGKWKMVEMHEATKKEIDAE